MQAITVVDSGSSSTTGIGGQTLVTGTPTPGSFVEISCAGAETCVVPVSGTFVATVVIETSGDGGATWYGVSAVPIGETTPVSSITGPGAVSFDVSGCTNVRVRCTTFTSGTIFIGV